MLKNPIVQWKKWEKKKYKKVWKYYYTQDSGMSDLKTVLKADHTNFSIKAWQEWSVIPICFTNAIYRWDGSIYKAYISWLLAFHDLVKHPISKVSIWCNGRSAEISMVQLHCKDLCRKNIWSGTTCHRLNLLARDSERKKVLIMTCFVS